MGVNQYTVASGGVTIENVNITNGILDLNGVANCLILDADADTHISSPTDDQIDISIGGADDFTITANSINVLSGSVIAASGNTFTPFIPLSAQQSLTGAGAINITTYYTAWTTTAADAGTLIDGVAIGQLKKIQLKVDGGDGTLTPTNLAGGTTITFNDIGDTVELVWDGTDWVALALYNIADGTTAPVLA